MRTRQRNKIDREQFEKLCALQCTEEEICSWFDCQDDTLASWCEKTYGLKFSEVFKRKRGKGRISLRRSQFQLAETNASMGIWLGKQYLGQTDKVQILQPNPQMDALLAAIRGDAPEDKGDTTGG